MILQVDSARKLTLLQKRYLQSSLEQDIPIIFPTDTVMGIGINGKSQRAMMKLFSIKKREPSKPLILFLPCIQKGKKYIQNEAILEDPFIRNNWPGELTIVCKKSKQVQLFHSPDSSISTIGIRVPNVPYLLDFLDYLPFPLLTTSANISGLNPIEDVESAQKIFRDQVLILSLPKHQKRASAQPSTIVAYVHDTPVVLREGPVKYPK